MDLTLAICMYNAEKYIEQTLTSVLGQTRQDFQLLIVDDCSTDDSGQMVNNFFAVHPRQYRMQRLEANQGIAYARQWALTHSETKYLVFVDADDSPLLLVYGGLKDSETAVHPPSSWKKYIL